MKKSKLPTIDKKNFPYTLVMVYWEDIVGDVAWADISDIKKSKTAVWCCVGGLVSHTCKTNVFMAYFIFEDNVKIKQGGGYTTIPTKNVLSIKKIKL